MADPNEHAHLLQQHQELTSQVEVAKEALKGAKAAEGGATQTLQNQLKSLEDALAANDAQMKAAGLSGDKDEAARQQQVKQAQDQANIGPIPDPEENKRQEAAQRENMANRNKPAEPTSYRSGKHT